MDGLLDPQYFLRWESYLIFLPLQTGPYFAKREGILRRSLQKIWSQKDFNDLCSCKCFQKTGGRNVQKYFLTIDLISGNTVSGGVGKVSPGFNRQILPKIRADTAISGMSTLFGRIGLGENPQWIYPCWKYHQYERIHIFQRSQIYVQLEKLVWGEFLHIRGQVNCHDSKLQMMSCFLAMVQGFSQCHLNIKGYFE